MEVWSAERIYIKGKFERDWAIMVADDGIIQAIGPRQQLVAQARKVNHYAQSIILPAFVNPHHHGFHTIYKGIVDLANNYSELLEKLVWPLSQVIDLDLFEALYWLAFAEQAHSGVGTIGEFHYLHNGAGPTSGAGKFSEKIIEIATNMGLRLTLVYSLFDQGSPENTKAFVQPLEQGLEELESLMKRYKNHPLVNVIPGVHGLIHTSSKAIKAADALAKKYETNIHVQLAERENELISVNAQYGTTPLRALERMGVLSERMVVINGSLLEDEEIQIMKRKNMRAVTCPSAALAKGATFPNVLGFLNENIPFAVASDSVCMNNTFSVPDEIKWIEFTLRNRVKGLNVLSSHHETFSLLDLGTTHGAAALGVSTGDLMPGMPADFMVVDLSGPSFRPRWRYLSDHFMQQLIYGWGPQVNVTHLLVNGYTVLDNGNLSFPELAHGYKRIEQWCDAFLKSLGNSTDHKKAEN